MHSAEKKTYRIDPSNIQQTFEEFQIKMHCCRYWKFSKWSSNELTAPFWRLYHNELPGAFLLVNDLKVELNRNSIYLLPPNTSYSIYKGQHQLISDEIEGTRINPNDSISSIEESGKIDHFFIHFNLGILHDNIAPQLFKVALSEYDQYELSQIKDHLKLNHKAIPFEILTKIQRLVLLGVSQIPNEAWKTTKYDSRIDKALKTIQNNLTETILNSELAKTVNLATNSFARLFKEQVGVSIQQYVLKKRIEKSLSLLHHSNLKIEAIAQECGFYDLHHFSRVFKKELGVSPSVYKKQSTMG